MMHDFDSVISDIKHRILRAPVVCNERWQSVSSPQDTRELLNYSFTLDLPSKDPRFYQEAIKPNMPWAERHFLEERVSGDPINPGETWRIWPYSASADKHRRPGEVDPQFDHSYAERYWPKFAGMTSDGRLSTTPPEDEANKGYRFPYGDLDDLVTLLANEPTTRQAYLPIWFPEDLGACRLKKRVPCSLGYQLIMRDNKLHIVYYLRSCDFVRHFRDDVYLTIRLALWVLEQCRLAAPGKEWSDVKLGTLRMHVTSLHVFVSDIKILE